MMGDKIITEIATILDIVFEFPALSQTCLKIESPVIFQKFKSPVTVRHSQVNCNFKEIRW